MTKTDIIQFIWLLILSWYACDYMRFVNMVIGHEEEKTKRIQEETQAIYLDTPTKGTH